MRKIVITLASIIILVAVIILFVPFYMGGQLKNHQLKLFKMHGIFDNPNLKIKILAYHRGWFSSKEKLQVSYQPPQATTPTFEDTMDVTIKHGPLIYISSDTDQKRFYFARGIILMKSTQPDFMFKGMGVWQLNNDFEYDVTAKQFAYSNFKQKISYQDIKINSVYNLTHKNLRYQLLIGEGNISMPYQKSDTVNEETYIIFKNLNARADLIRSNAHWVGDRQFQIESLIAKTPMDQLIKINALSGTSTVQEKQNKVQVDFKAKAKEVNFGHATLHDFNLDFSLIDLDSKATHQLLTFLQTSRTDKELTVQQKEELTKYYMQILNSGITLNLSDLYFKTQEGQFRLSLKYSILGSSTSLPLAILIANSELSGQLMLPKIWLQNALAYIFAGRKFHRPNEQEPLGGNEMANLIIKQALQNKLITELDSQYNIRFQFRGGKLLFDGKKFDLNTDVPIPESQIKIESKPVNSNTTSL